MRRCGVLPTLRHPSQSQLSLPLPASRWSVRKQARHRNREVKPASIDPFVVVEMRFEMEKDLALKLKDRDLGDDLTAIRAAIESLGYPFHERVVACCLATELRMRRFRDKIALR